MLRKISVSTAMIKKLLNALFRNRHILGIASLIVSLAPYVSGLKTGAVVTIAYGFYVSGIIYLCDYITEKIGGWSFIKRMMISNRRTIIYILVAAIGGAFLDGIMNFLGGYWYYPYWSKTFYLVIFSPGFAFYFLSVLMSYIATKNVLDAIRKGTKKVTKGYKFEPTLYTILGVIGVVILLYVFYEILRTTNLFRDIDFVVQYTHKQYLTVHHMFITFFGIWFIAEYIAWRRHRTSILKNMLHGYYNPLYAILISALLLAIYMELQNDPLQLWIYTNVPLENIEVLGLPLLMYIGWPFHYLGFFSLYHALGGDLAYEVYAGDKIE